MKAEINSLKNRKVSLIIQSNLVSLKQKQIRQCLKGQLKKEKERERETILAGLRIFMKWADFQRRMCK